MTIVRSLSFDRKGVISDRVLPLRINFLWTLSGNIVYAGSQWGMLVVLAKLGTPEMVGQFALALAVTAPLFMFTNLQLRAVQATDARHNYLFGHYLGLRIVSTILALMLITVVTLVGGYSWETTIVILAVGVAKSFESVSDVFFGLLQQHERMDRIAISMMIKGPISLIALSTGVLLTDTVFWGALSLSIAWGVLLFSYDVRSGLLVLMNQSKGTKAVPISRQIRAKLLRPIWQIQVLKRLTWLTLPLGFSMMLISLKSNIPRYFVEYYWGERQLGIFATMAYLMICGGMVVIALGQSASQRLAKQYLSLDRWNFFLLLTKLLGIGALVGFFGLLASVLLGREILTLLYGYEYAEETYVLRWLMAAAGVSYLASCLNYAMIALRYLSAMLFLNILVLTAVALLCIWLVPLEGLVGAALALLVGHSIYAMMAGAIVSYGIISMGK